MQPRRREFLQLGGVSLLSTGLLQVLAARGAAGGKTVVPTRGKAKACIILFQVGGVYQCDTLDPKPAAAEEIRGPFKRIATKAAGVFMTEALPQVAKQAGTFAILRSVHHTIRCHNPAIYCSLVGREATDPMAVSNRTAAKRTDHPHYASVLARLRPGQRSMPNHVIIPDVTNNGPAKSPGLLAGYLGAAYDPFVLGADPNSKDFRVESVALPPDLGQRRVRGRQALLHKLEGQQRFQDRNGNLGAMSTFYQRAFDLLTAAGAKQAFDLSQESASLRDRYGRHTVGQSTLLARRLVEAGVPFVTVFSHTDVDKGSWDTHTQHYERV
ncbi:MAG TPA: DUF1501 domain-containing protein, partial [Gemmataceae bacterium]|nr:DUF1501 domain-containing protein [Gemmataceae bacterium]